MEMCFSHTVTETSDARVVEIAMPYVSRQVREDMTPDELLHGSIEKWRYIERVINDLAQANPYQAIVLIDGGTWTCMLCLKYYDNGCAGCPVRMRTELPICQTTPYAAVGRRNNAHIVLERVREELAFLMSLQHEV